MAAQKSSKGELVAICRLEFYRKQKNWKFCSQERRGKEAKKKDTPKRTTNVKLNQTYSIEPCPVKEEPTKPEEPEPEQHPDLDQAFVETETGTVSESDDPAQSDVNEGNPNEAPETDNKLSSSLDPPDSPYSPKWSIQRWAERHRLWNPEPSPIQDSNCPQPQTNPTELAHYPTLESNYENPELYYTDHDPNIPIEGANYPISYIPEDNYQIFYHETGNYIQDSFNPKLLYYNSHMGHGSDVPQCEDVLSVGKLREWDAHAWDEARCGGEGAAWGDSPDWLEAPAHAGRDFADGPGSPRRDDWLREDLSWESEPSASSAEFSRGAALQPHSTQLDLRAPAAEGPGSGAGSGAGAGAGAAGLSRAGLAAALARHEAALAALRAEALRRLQCPLTDPLCNFDEVPVRDPGLAGPVYHPPVNPFNDPILAGSYRNKPDLRGHTEHGRGRGKRLIGIGMGRPYRL